MLMLDVLLILVAGYIVILLLLEAVIWKVQPNMENGVTLFVNLDDTIVPRKLYGFDYDNKLYVSSNHWFRRWYHAVLETPDIDVEHAGELKPCTAIPIAGKELTEVSGAYKMGFVLRTICGFAPRRFLRLDPREEGPSGG